LSVTKAPRLCHNLRVSIVYLCTPLEFFTGSYTEMPVYTHPHILRHVMDQTLEGYLHLAAPKSAVVRSPIEDL